MLINDVAMNSDKLVNQVLKFNHFISTVRLKTVKIDQNHCGKPGRPYPCLSLNAAIQNLMQLSNSRMFFNAQTQIGFPTFMPPILQM